MVGVYFENRVKAFNGLNGYSIKLVEDKIRSKYNLHGGGIVVIIDGENYDTIEGQFLTDENSYMFIGGSEAQGFFNFHFFMCS
jgi:hypothetical protein